MGNLNLKPQPFLSGYAKSFDGVDLREIDDVSLVSLAFPLGAEDASTKAIESCFGVSMPSDGNSDLSKDGSTRVMRVARDQVFVSFSNDGTDPAPHITKKLDGAAYATDQSHVWVVPI